MGSWRRCGSALIWARLHPNMAQDIDEAIDAETKTHAELDDDPIDSVEHRAIVGRARRLTPPP
eukprot:3402859-Prymnesium_polylepis.1